MIKDIGETMHTGICYMCTEGCPSRIYTSNGKINRIEMVDETVEALCPRAKAQLEFIYHPDRLKYPLRRKGVRGSGEFERISWDDALDIVAENLLKVKREYGPESVVFYIAYTKEPRPYFHRLAHAFGSPNYCTESSNCYAAAWLAALINFGFEYGPFLGYARESYPETRCQLFWSTSVKNNVPPVWTKMLNEKKRGGKFIVVDPRRTELAKLADVHLQLRPGTDGALALGIMNVIVSEKLQNQEFIDRWTTGWNEMQSLIAEYPPEKVEQITWVPTQLIKEAARLYASIKPAKLNVSPQSTTHHTNGVQNHRAILLLAAITGNIGIKGGNLAPAPPVRLNDITLHERINSMPPGIGADRFPLWTRLYKEHQSNVIAERIENPEPYPIKALLGAGLNKTFFPDSNRFYEAFKKLDFLVITEYFHTDATPLADVVLPIASWVERPMLLNSTVAYRMSNKLVQYIQPAIEPLGESWPEYKIYFELAKKLGLGKEFWDGDLEKCYNYILEHAGLTLDDLKNNPDGLPSTKNTPKYRTLAEGFSTSTGKIEMSSTILKERGYEPLPVYQEPIESPVSQPELSKEYPLILTTGARNIAYTHSQFRRVESLRKLTPDPLLEIHPLDAEFRGISSGDRVIVRTPRGQAIMLSKVTDIGLPGVVQAPHQWSGEADINMVIDSYTLDPHSGFAPLKSQLCQVTRA